MAENNLSASELRARHGVVSNIDADKDKLFKGVCLSWFAAVIAHCLNLQSESVLFRNACGGDLARATRLASTSNAAASVLGVIVNQFGGKLSDSFGRKPFYCIGPLAQIIAGLVAYSNSTNPTVLACMKTFRVISTTFSGTVMGTAGMRDAFKGQEFGVKMAQAGGVIGIAIMIGPLLESIILRRANEKATYLALATLGTASLFANSVCLPETLPEEKRQKVDLGTALAGANPLGFVKIYTHGTPLLKRIATIATMQTMIDGKNMSDLGMIWMREHLKMSVESIRNFIMGYGFLSTLASIKLVPHLLKTGSASSFTTLTNCTNWLAFTMRGSSESTALYLAAMPFMLPGVNGASNKGLEPIVNREMEASGFQIGESTAWVNNLRVIAGAIATLLYGNCYAFCKERGMHAGSAYILAGLMGAGFPQLLFMLTVRASDLEKAK